MLFFFLVPVQRKKNFLVELLNSENRILLKDETSSVRYIWVKNPEPKIMQQSEYYSLLLAGQKYVDAYFLVDCVILKKKKLSFLVSGSPSGCRRCLDGMEVTALCRGCHIETGNDVHPKRTVL